MIEKRGQITIFVVIALIIVAAIVVIFLIRNQLAPTIPEAGVKAPSIALQFENGIKECVRGNTQKIIKDLMATAGDTEQEHVAFVLDEGTSNEKRYTYLCHIDSDICNTPCEPQIFLSDESFESKIEDYVSIKGRECVQEILNSATRNGFNVPIQDSPRVEVEIKPDRVDVSYIQAIEISKGNDKASFERFDIPISSVLASFLDIAREITDERKAGNKNIHSEINLRNLYDPLISVDGPSNTPEIDYTTLYTITKKGSNEKFWFAIRSHVPC